MKTLSKVGIVAGLSMSVFGLAAISTPTYATDLTNDYGLSNEEWENIIKSVEEAEIQLGAAQEALADATTEYNQAKSEYDAAVALDKAVDDAQAEYDEAKAAMDAMDAKAKEFDYDNMAALVMAIADGDASAEASAYWSEVSQEYAPTKNALADAETALDDAKAAAAEVDTDALKGAMDEKAEAMNDAEQKVKDAEKAVEAAEAQAKIDAVTAAYEDAQEAAKEAEKKLADAQEAYDDAKEAMDAMDAKAKEFGYDDMADLVRAIADSEASAEASEYWSEVSQDYAPTKNALADAEAALDDAKAEADAAEKALAAAKAAYEEATKSESNDPADDPTDPSNDPTDPSDEPSDPADDIVYYDFLDDSQEQIIARGQALRIRVDAEYGKFVRIYIDDNMEPLDSSYYTVEEGSTVITLSKAYLETLELGEHTFTAVFTDGVALGEFTIVAAESETKEESTKVASPDTGYAVKLATGTASASMLSAATLASIVAACSVIIKKSQRK